MFAFSEAMLNGVNVMDLPDKPKAKDKEENIIGDE
jgi:hypothetical protein